MKKEYVAPEWETVKLTLTSVIMTSILESSLSSEIGGGGADEGEEIDL